ncbi:hypothetical protein L596_008821 [Steinernema carpocapsae]|uniref:Uncharacterized protein n=1 Tax=Steinernema carpocapsae TaxID=34508 RepID=A0A4U5PE46_STECR|nr:hypothetical protein L596_008821 [Steinernema carpocapsae]
MFFCPCSSISCLIWSISFPICCNLSVLWFTPPLASLKSHLTSVHLKTASLVFLVYLGKPILGCSILRQQSIQLVVQMPLTTRYPLGALIDLRTQAIQEWNRLRVLAFQRFT